MTLTDSVTELRDTLDDLDQAFDNLLWAVDQGLPDEDQGHALVDHYETVSRDIIALVKEASEALAAVVYPDLKAQFDLPSTRQAVIISQDRFNRLANHFYNDLVSFERISALNNLGRQRRALAKWRRGVKDALDACPQHLHNVSQALFRCWQDLTERTGRSTVFAQATSSGPQIILAQKNGEEQ